MITFDEALEQTEGTIRSLLLGNGFSRACPEGGDFAWETLIDRSGIDETSETGQLFSILNTADFEKVLNHLDNTIMTANIYGQSDFERTLKTEADNVKEGLIRAIRSVHPERGDSIPRASREKCACFISRFDRVFTLNYDLLLYWVLQESASRERHDDGFRRPNGGPLTFSRPDHATIFHLHGAIHLFESTQGTTLKVSPQQGRTLFEQIEFLIEEKSRAPIYISEGDSHSKRAKIELYNYTRNAFSKLKSTDGSLFLFGVSLDDNDDHIVEAIKTSSINHVYACMHDAGSGLSASRSRLSNKFDGAEVELTFVESSTAPVW